MTALAEAKAKLKALSDQVRQARSDVHHYTYRTNEAADEATRAGVPEPEVTKARRLPRPPRKKEK